MLTKQSIPDKKSQMKIKPSYAGRSQPTKQSSSPRDLPTLRAHQDQREPNDIINRGFTGLRLSEFAQTSDFFQF